MDPNLSEGAIVGYEVVQQFHPQHHGINTRNGLAFSLTFELGERSLYGDKWIVPNGMLDYAGQGRPEKGDQIWDRFNRGMRRAMEEGSAVMIFEGLGGTPVRYKYHGNWFVIGVREVIVPETGQKTFRFTVSREKQAGIVVSSLPVTATEGAADLSEPPSRVETTTSRVIRDTELAVNLKRLYKYRCQLCDGIQVIGKEVAYAEAHHVRPLGRPHNGPDSKENVIVLCARHHVDFDYGAVAIDPIDRRTIRHRFDSDLDGKSVHVRAGHKLSADHLAYHYDNIFSNEDAMMS